MTLPLSLCLIVLQAAQATPAQKAPPELSAGERAALGTIGEKKVRQIISFLASDELEGRDTPSVGLRKAGDYVAGRFEAAGLSGLGAEGSFFLPAEVSTTTLPKTGVKLVGKDGKALAQHGLLHTVAGEALEIAGRVFDAGSGLPAEGESPYAERGDAAPAPFALVDEQEPARVPSRRPGQPPRFSAMIPLTRQCREAKRHGARVLLVRVTEESALLAEAARLQGRPLMRRRSRLSLPVVLVPADFAAKEAEALLPPFERTKTEVRNVCGLLRGSDAKLAREAIVVSAHLDHIGLGGGGGDRIRNGADDDATGCTAVMALAEAFASLEARPARSLVFVTFWGEEKGLLGSRHFVENSPWPLEKIVANVNLEMLGRPEKGAKQKCWMTGWTESDLGSLVALGAKRAGVTVFEHRRYSRMLYSASDNASFVRKGVVAHSFSAGSLHADYHQPGDEWEKLDLPHMTKVIQGLFAGTLPIAKGRYRPQKTR